ncbi:peptidase inhibitor family I36 protein [Streptomyces bullii]
MSVKLSVAGAIVALTASFGLTPVAHAAPAVSPPADCPQGDFCIYSRPGYNGLFKHITPPEVPWFPYGGSAWNATKECIEYDIDGVPVKIIKPNEGVGFVVSANTDGRYVPCPK